ncbi:MAG: sugar transferase [Planctomycetota bacterium]|jgi:sugar transferase (PEP-CTERM system associated)
MRDRARRPIGRILVGLPVSTWLLVDLSILSTGLYFAYSLFPPPDLPDTPHIGLWPAWIIFASMCTMAGLIFGLYERETVMSRSHIATRIVLTAGAATVMVYAVIYVLMYATVSRRVTGVTMSAFVVAGVGVRLGVWWAIHKVHRGLLVVGPHCLYESFERAQENGDLNEYRLVGYAATDIETTDAVDRPECLGSIIDQVPGLSELMVTDIVVGADAARDPRVMDWMVPCLQRGCRVTNEAIFYEKATGQILVDEITPLWFLFADLKVNSDRRAILKRAIDLITALVGFCVLAPLWPVIALAIKLCDGGPVFYSQDRVGQNGLIFKLHKFRTMRQDAENGKSVWASPDDPRVTRVGRFLRRTRLDELPQLYNVLMGQMSIIGPRPERPDIVLELCGKLPYYAERHLVKPGITGWAQISFRYGSSIEDARRKLQYDLYYLKHMSLELDTMILFRTIGTFIRGSC